MRPRGRRAPKPESPRRPLPLEAMLPLAHASHWLWVLYLPPILVVLASIVWTTFNQRRGKR